MSDRLTTEQRHKNMAAIRAKDTKPEMIVRKYLWSHGFRYRQNHHRLPGKPDIVLLKYRTCIFVNGCFWHGHYIYDNGNLNGNGNEDHLHLKNSECCKIPKSNREFWVKKIMRNKERDIEVQQKLASMGWHCITIWECELKPSIRNSTLESLTYTLNRIFLQDHQVYRYEMTEDERPMIAAEDDEIVYGR